ncbi:unnamed protein product, partial [Mesorhabditis belari]|uniref:Uncharacterized protein n=1 Tax=Mesorhabditis belari TaxID=2138241 RepID=A0AAF3F310_9BILA
MPPSANLCCCRHSRKKPLTEGIRRSTEVGTMVLNVCGKYDPHLGLTPTTPAANGDLANGGPSVDKTVETETHTHVEEVVIRLVESAPRLEMKENELEHHHINHDFDTARTSREEAVRDHLTMHELVRQVRLEEGLEVTPRPSVSEVEPRRPTLQQTTILNAYSTYTTTEPIEAIVEERTLIHMNGSLKSKPKRAVFNENDDISSRTANTVVVDIERVDEVNVIPTVSGILAKREHHFILPPMQETTGRTIARTVAAIPQTVFTVVSVTYAYCVSIIAFLASFVWK